MVRYSAWSFFCSLKALDVGVGRLLYIFHSYTKVRDHELSGRGAILTYQSIDGRCTYRVHQMNGQLQNEDGDKQGRHL